MAKSLLNIKKLLLQKIFEITMRINYKTKTQVFFNYSPHVDTLSLRVFKNGWGHDSKVDYEHDIRCDDIEQLDLIVDFLETLEQEAEKV